MIPDEELAKLAGNTKVDYYAKALKGGAYVLYVGLCPIVYGPLEPAQVGVGVLLRSIQGTVQLLDLDGFVFFLLSIVIILIGGEQSS